MHIVAIYHFSERIKLNDRSPLFDMKLNQQEKYRYLYREVIINIIFSSTVT